MKHLFNSIFLLLVLLSCNDARQQLSVTVHGTSDNVTVIFNGGTSFTGMKRIVYENVSLPFYLEQTIPELGPCPDMTLMVVSVKNFEPGYVNTITFEVQHEERNLHISGENPYIQIENDIKSYSGEMMIIGGGDLSVGYFQSRKECEEEEEEEER